MKPSNFHQHSYFCDGKDSPEEVVLEAIRLGCPAIGFSSHSYTEFDSSWCMTPKATEEYIKTVNELKLKYKGIIDIYLGVEYDYYSDINTDAFDYIIGSVHYVLKNGEYLQVDTSRDEQIRIVNEVYNGDFYSFIEDYYKVEADVYAKTHCNIIGHFDLITKFNEDGKLFDTKHPRYINAVNSALNALCKTPAVFEINTGAISRGYRTEPYPEKTIIEKIKNAGKSLIYTSDCHDKKNLLFGFPSETDDFSDFIKHK